VPEWLIDWFEFCKYLYPALVLSPGQTITTCQRNISQHCWAQQVAIVWPPCCNVLWYVGCCWIKFENGQIWANNTQHVAICRNRVAKRTQDVTPKNVALSRRHRLAGAFNVKEKSWYFLCKRPSLMKKTKTKTKKEEVEFVTSCTVSCTLPVQERVPHVWLHACATSMSPQFPFSSSSAHVMMLLAS